MAFPPAFLEELRARLSVSEVAGKSLRLARAGREWKACCPFHNEKSPSFYINDEKGFFHCFGCGAHGDIVGFTMRHDHLSFLEAVERLAGQAGLQVPASTPTERKQAERQKSLYDLIDTASRFFEQSLFSRDGQKALAYLRGRGVTDDTIASFRLGYAPADGGALPKALQSAGYKLDDACEAGLLRRPDDGRSPYSFFRGRVIFPVSDRRGRVVAFGARLLDGDGPKYINSPDHPLFHKGTMLYGLSRARMAVQKQQPIIVTEGYMDVIALVTAGFTGAVAPLGTALTEAQIAEVWKAGGPNAPAPILCFDGDAAGDRAAARAIERVLPHLSPDHTVRIAHLPPPEDPDSLIRNRGVAAMQLVLDQAVPLAEKLWQVLVGGQTLTSPEARAGLQTRLDAQIARIQNPIVQNYYKQDARQRLAALFGWQNRPQTAQSGWGGGKGKKLAPFKRGQQTQQQLPVKRLPPVITTLRERIFLAAPLNYPDLLADLAEPLGLLHFRDEALESLRQSLLEFLMHRQVSDLPSEESLDVRVLHEYLSRLGHGRALDLVLCESTYMHAAFARPGHPPDVPLKGWWGVYEQDQQERVAAELRDAGRKLALDLSDPDTNLDVSRLRRIDALREAAAAAPDPFEDDPSPTAR
jgi:DNA primase